MQGFGVLDVPLTQFKWSLGLCVAVEDVLTATDLLLLLFVGGGWLRYRVVWVLGLLWLLTCEIERFRLHQVVNVFLQSTGVLGHWRL